MSYKTMIYFMFLTIYTRPHKLVALIFIVLNKGHPSIHPPLDVVPERRTKRFPPRFRPVGHFCDLRFRHLSSPTGREGEISRPLGHMRQIPFIHSARLIDSTNFYMYRTGF